MDPLKQAAERLRELVGYGDGHQKLLLAIADALDPPPEPEPIPPGELVADTDHILLFTTDKGLRYIDSRIIASARDVVSRATTEDVRKYAFVAPTSILMALQAYARLAVSQEQPPELKNDDAKYWVVTEKRIGRCGECLVNAMTGTVYEISFDSAHPVWIVEKK